MKSKFALSFGISLILVGILNIFWPINNLALLGVSISSFVFSLINFLPDFINNGKSSWILNLLYIIPFAILLSFCCYGNYLINYKIIQKILNSNINNIITFISFGFLFISEFCNYRKGYNENQLKNINFIEENLVYTSEILKSLQNFETKIEKNDNYDLLKLIKEINSKCKEKLIISTVEFELLSIHKYDFSIDDVKNALTKTYNRFKHKNKK